MPTSNRRTFLTGSLAAVASAVSAAPEAAADPVPSDHWAYAAVRKLEWAGARTGMPNQTFSGSRPQSRARFAAAIHRLLSESAWLSASGADWKPHATLPPRLERLVREFQPELLARGLTGADLDAGIREFRRLWRDPTPRDGPSPYGLPWFVERQRPLWPLQEAARAAGAASALRALQRGEPFLYSALPAADLGAGFDAALPLVSPGDPERLSDAELQRIMFHNAALFREARRQPGTLPERFRWVGRALNLRESWVRLRPTPGLGFNRPVECPDGPIRLVWALAPDAPAQLGVIVGERLIQLPRPGYWWDEVRWGPPATATVALRLRTEAEVRYCLLDLRNGGLLAAQ